MKKASAADARGRVSAYIAKQPPPARRMLRSFRRLIRTAAPRAEEAWSYAIPAFRLDGRILVWYAGFREHCSLFPATGAVRKRFARQLKDRVVSKGTIRFPLDEPLPATLVKGIIRVRAAEVRAAVKKRG